MRLLVTGGTGFVGRAVLAELHRAGHEIHFLSRRGHSAACYAIEEQFNGQIRSGNILEPQSLREACRGIDGVVHLVGIISETGNQTYERVHTEGTRNMLKAARDSGVKRFIHMSALGTRPHAASRYHQSKWDAEELVRGSGLDWTIFRPSIIYGPGDGFVNLFARISRWSPVMPLIGGGRSRFQPVPFKTVAEAFARSVQNPSAERQTFTLSGPEILTLEQIVDTVLNVTGRKRIKLSVPFTVARFQARILEFVFSVLGKAPPLNRDQLVMLLEDNIGDGHAATELFGLKIAPFREGISSYLGTPRLRHHPE